MKILLIGFTKLAYMPYMNFYLDQLTKTDNEIHLLYWNRDGKGDIKIANNVKTHEFKLIQKDEVSKFRKISGFIKFRKKAKQLLLNSKFDLIIVMHTIPGVVLYNVLMKHYSNRYILDYRDVTYESIGFYKKIIHKLVDYSIATFVSSNAFRSYLPENKNIFTTHNILLDSLKNRQVRSEKSRDITPIRIRFWGFIRHENINKAIIARLANDTRFELHFHGREQETAVNLKCYCEKLSIKNVYFHGEYKPEERYFFAKETEIIHNLYDNDKMTQPAMANKYYDGITFFIPQLCNTGSYMGELIGRYNIGLKCNPYDENFADIVYKYYTTMMWEEFKVACNERLDEILKEYENGINVFMNIAQKNAI